MSDVHNILVECHPSEAIREPAANQNMRYMRRIAQGFSHDGEAVVVYGVLDEDNNEWRVADVGGDQAVWEHEEPVRYATVIIHAGATCEIDDYDR